MCFCNQCTVLWSSHCCNKLRPFTISQPPVNIYITYFAASFMNHCVLKIKNVLLWLPRRSKNKILFVWNWIAEAKLFPQIIWYPAHSSLSSGSFANPSEIAFATSLSNFTSLFNLAMTKWWWIENLSLTPNSFLR